MVLLIDIFSINRSRGYENPRLDIIVIDLCSTRGFPLEQVSEHFSHNQSALSGVILISFQCYCGVVLDIFLFIFHFYHFIYVLHTFYIWTITDKWILRLCLLGIYIGDKGYNYNERVQ
jgi:hypothetical protein